MISVRELVSAAAVACALTGSTVMPAGPAGAESFTGVFRAKATASGVRVTYIVPKGSVSDTIADVGAPASEALLDSLGESRAFASFPYPGDLPSNAPGLLRGLAGIPAPDYPFYVSSFYPSRPRQQAGLGPYLIAAESNDTLTTATADIGYHDAAVGSIGALRATTSAAALADGVVAEATDEISSFSVGPLKIGHVLSSARVRMAADGTLTREADTRIVGAMADQTPVTITSEGIEVADSPVGKPPAEPVEGLAKAGITVSLASASDLPHGVVAPALRITYRTADGTSLNYELGAASATIQGTASEPAASAPSDDGGGQVTAPQPAGRADEAAIGASITAEPGSVAPPLAESVSAGGVDLEAAPMWLDVPGGVTASARTLLPSDAATLPTPSPNDQQSAVPTASVSSPQPVASITRAGLLAHLINGGNLQPLYGLAMILFAVGGSGLVAGLRRAGAR